VQPASARRDLSPCPRTPRRGWGTSRIWSRRRSRTPRPTPNSLRLGPGSLRPPMTRGAASNAICTTAPNSGWSRWASKCAPRKRRCPPNCAQSRNRFHTSLQVWPASQKTCKRSHAVFIPRSCPGEDWAPRSRRWPAARRSRSSSTLVFIDGCPALSKWPPTTSSPKPSPTRPNTHKPPR